jgi:ankyrin repeat protein
LLQEGADPDSPDNERRTPIFHAIIAGSLPGVKSLVEYSCHIDQMDNNGESPLFLAFRKSEKEIVRALIEDGADTLQQCRKKRTCLFAACESGNSELFLILLAYMTDAGGGRIFLEKDADGVLPIDVARERGHVQVCCTILWKFLRYFKKIPPKNLILLSTV